MKKLWCVAHVGMSTPPTSDDLIRLGRSWALGLPRRHRADRINLRTPIQGHRTYEPRDFLLESEQYDAVVLHSVMHSNEFERPGVWVERWKQMGLISPHHSVEKWRTRLMSTRAKLIIVWELLPCTLSGWNLDALDGYRIKQRDARVTVYQRRAKKGGRHG